MTRIPLFLVAFALLFPATASAKACSFSESNAGNLTVKNTTCKVGRDVARARLEGDTSPLGYTCKAKAYEGGATNTCTKGDKRVRFQVAD